MININELRKGNWISFKDLWHGQVESINKVSIDIVGNNGLFTHDCFIPVELTPDLLEKCTFDVKYSGKNTGANYDAWATIGFIQVKFLGKDVIVMQSTGGVRSTLDHIKYLHQLQNLYHALIGKELEYTP